VKKTKPDGLMKPPDVLVQDLEGEAVLLNLTNGQYYGLDAQSFDVYKSLISLRNVEETHEVLLQKYVVEPERLKADLDDFVARLLENGLLFSVE
jgi:hypothetical protein